jgi:ABC-type antimicrobial peptide transport system permease subunit
LEHQAATIPQQRWISKLMGYDFSIEYKQGKENWVADALSRQFEASFDSVEFSLSLSLISFPPPSWVAELKAFYATDLETQSIL